MDIRNRRILILGGWGLVGTAILHKLATRKPEKVIVLSLREHEAREACNTMAETYPDISYIPEWGNIFVRENMKDLSRDELLNCDEYRHQLMRDTMESFTEDVLTHSFLHQVISRHKPHIIIDTVNTSTALAYQDVYNSYYKLSRSLSRRDDDLVRIAEQMMTTLYIPQIIRHVQILHSSMVKNKTSVYLKIGTTGTGGMGLNIPYTHSEERPSRVLLSKTSLAGAHTMLLFLMGRTPGGPICKEIKPAAAIAWKGIQFGEVHKHGHPIELYDCPVERAETLEETFRFSGKQSWVDLKDTLKSVYIDTGENGIFSSGEFETITAAGQMEFVTPEEIAENVIMEIVGDSTGHDIINALDNSIMSPTYRAGYMRHHALEKMDALKKKHGSASVAFEILGPPRLSKLLYEAHLLHTVSGDLKNIVSRSAADLSDQAEAHVVSNQHFRSHAISIGIPILLKDGKTLLRGPQVKIPTQLSRESLEITPEKINEWASAGWIDLREENMSLWKQRVLSIITEVRSLSPEDTSSRYHHGIDYWELDRPLKIGKVAAWIFTEEDEGGRVKR
ncbi:MAG: short-chain dehydrogenase [Fidelibacterota bacterium]